MRSLTLLLTLALAGCGHGAPLGVTAAAARPVAAQAVASQGTLLYGAYVGATVKATKKVADGLQLTVLVEGPQPMPQIGSFHGKLVFTYPLHAKPVKVGDHVEGFISYVTVDEKTGTFINEGTDLKASAFELKIN